MNKQEKTLRRCKSANELFSKSRDELCGLEFDLATISKSKFKNDNNLQTSSSDDTFDEEKEWVTLRFDNVEFTTTRSTLTGDKDSVLYIMFKKDSPYSLPRDSKGAYLFDRNPIYFAPILNYLRTGELVYDENVNPKGILNEAKFFNIQGIIPQLQEIVKEKERKKLVKLKKPDLTREFIVKSLITCPSGSNSLRFQGLNLSGLDLSGLDLSGINFQKSDMTGCILNNATLDKADLRQCHMNGASLINASLCNVNLCKAVMRGIIMTGASLCNSDLQFCGNIILTKLFNI